MATKTCCLCICCIQCGVLPRPTGVKEDNTTSLDWQGDLKRTLRSPIASTLVSQEISFVPPKEDAVVDPPLPTRLPTDRWDQSRPCKKRGEGVLFTTFFGASLPALRTSQAGVPGDTSLGSVGVGRVRRQLGVAAGRSYGDGWHKGKVGSNDKLNPHFN